MAATDVEIANLALTGLSADRIASLTDDNETARKVNAIYAKKRRQVLRAHPWNFAVARAILAQASTAPAFGYTYAYALPPDCLRVLDLNKPYANKVGDEFHVEAAGLVTNAATAYVRYVSDVADASKFDDLFIDAFAALLQAELAYSIANSPNLAKLAMTVYASKLAEARSASGQEGTPPQVPESAFVSDRDAGTHV